jgi:hypothetical protein
MADTFYAVEYPIDFKVNGDDTAAAIGKNIQELTKVYEHLNYLKDNQPGFLALSVTNGTAVNPGVDSYQVYFREDSIPVEPLIPAGVGSYGTVRYRDVLTETTLYEYLRTAVAGTPIGGILLWAHGAAAIPPGFAVCDGANGTPDLRGLFVKGYSGTQEIGTTGGADSATLPESTVLPHTHEVDIEVTVPGHEHDLSLLASANTSAHTHVTGDYYMTFAASGAHSHTYIDNYLSFGMPWLAGDDDISAGARSVDAPAYLWEHTHTSSRTMSVTAAEAPHKHPFTGVTSTNEQDVLGLTGETSAIGIANEVAIPNVPLYRDIIYIQKKA